MMGAKRPSSLVIHRSPHPTMDAVCSRWFTYAGQDWGLLYGGDGDGWTLMDLTDPVRVPTVRDGYMRLSEVRKYGPADIDYYLTEKTSSPAVSS